MNRRTHTLRPPRRSGFTIVEAVVLISIVGIIAAVAAPRFLALSEMDAARAHRQALADFRYAQRVSANSGCPVQVDFGIGLYTLTRRTNCRSGAYSQPMVDPVSNTTPYSVTLPIGVAITSSVDPLVFDALGRATTTAGVVSSVSIAVGPHALEAIGETGLVRVP